MKTAANADSIYVDPSALLKLYLHQKESAAMSAWRSRAKGPLSLTHHGRVEVTNGICLAAHRREISPEALTDTLSSLEEDLATGIYRTADLLWRAALDRATELSRKYTPKLGTRSLDILHVASALELGSRIFVTYDNRQAELARAVGMKVSSPTA